MRNVGNIVYVVDNNWTSGGNRVHKWETPGALTAYAFVGWIGKKETTQVTNGWHTGDSATAGAASLNGAMQSPRGLAIDNVNNILYVADYYRYNIVRFTLSTGVFIDKTNVADLPSHLRIGIDGNLYVTSHTNDDVRIYDPITMTSIGSFGTLGNGDGQMNNPSGIFFSGYDIFVIDNVNYRLQKW